jgi:hypothetical protein
MMMKAGGATMFRMALIEKTLSKYARLLLKGSKGMVATHPHDLQMRFMPAVLYAKQHWPATMGLACIPLVVFSVAALTRPARPPPAPAPTASFRDHFREAVTDVALAKPREDLQPVTKKVRTERIVAPAPAPVVQPSPPPPAVEQPFEEPTPVPRHRQRHRIIKRASLDICARHNLRKVHYGRTWRCRR